MSVNQPRKPKDSPGGVGGQYDTWDTGARNSMPPTLNDLPRTHYGVAPTIDPDTERFWAQHAWLLSSDGREVESMRRAERVVVELAHHPGAERVKHALRGVPDMQLAEDVAQSVMFERVLMLRRKAASDPRVSFDERTIRRELSSGRLITQERCVADYFKTKDPVTGKWRVDVPLKHLRAGNRYRLWCERHGIDLDRASEAQKDRAWDEAQKAELEYLSSKPSKSKYDALKGVCYSDGRPVAPDARGNRILTHRLPDGTVEPVNGRRRWEEESRRLDERFGTRERQLQSWEAENRSVGGSLGGESPSNPQAQAVHSYLMLCRMHENEDTLALPGGARMSKAALRQRLLDTWWPGDPEAEEKFNALASIQRVDEEELPA